MAKTASRIYPLAYAIVLGTKSSEYFQYLCNELRMLRDGGLELKADPLLSSLTEPEKESTPTKGISKR